MGRERKPDKKRFLPGFGGFLAKARKKAGFKTQAEAIEALKHRFSRDLTGSLQNYETGIVSDPNPEVLRMLTSIYNVSFHDVVMELITEKYGLSAEDRQMLVRAFAKRRRH